MVQPTTRGAGSNWKALKRTLDGKDSDQITDRTKHRKRIRSSTSAGSLTEMHNTDENVVHHNGSESLSLTTSASTSLPWFAEDLNEEDVALLMATSESASSASAITVAQSQDPIKRRAEILGGGELLSQEKRKIGQYVAIDCEMVGVGPKGSQNVLARVSLVNWHGAVLLDTFVQAKEKVTDYRTWVSGVRPQDLRYAPSFEEVQERVADLIKDRILIGHAIQNDLRVLLLSHPGHLIRDTAIYSESQKIVNSNRPSLRKLVAAQLQIDIQQPGAEHSSVEDAQATMALYKTFHREWSASLNGSRAIRTKGRSSFPSNNKNMSANGGTQIIGQGWKNSKNSRRTQRGAVDAGPSTSVTMSKSQTSAGRRSDDAEWYKSVDRY